MKHRILIIAFAALVVTLSSGQFGQWRPSTSDCCPPGGCQVTPRQGYPSPRTTAPRSATQVPAPSRIVSPFTWPVEVPVEQPKDKPAPKPQPPKPGPLAPVEPAKPKPQSPGGPQLQACEDRVAALHMRIETLQDKLETLTQSVNELRKECDEQPVFNISEDALLGLAKRIQEHLEPIHVKVEVLDRPPENPQFEQDVYLGGTLPLRLFPVPPKPE